MSVAASTSENRRSCTIAPSARRTDTQRPECQRNDDRSVIRYLSEPSDNRRVDNRRHEPMRLEPPGHDGVHGLVVGRETALDGKLRPDAPHEVGRRSGLGERAGQRSRSPRLPTIATSAANAPAQCIHTASVAGNTLSAAAMPTHAAAAGYPQLRRPRSADSRKFVICPC